MSCRVWPSSDHPGDELSDSELEHRQAQAEPADGRGQVLADRGKGLLAARRAVGGWLWVGEDSVAADPAPPDRRLPADLNPLERRPAIGASEAPGHLPHPPGALQRLYSQPGRPRNTGIGDVALYSWDELVADHLPEAAELVV